MKREARLYLTNAVANLRDHADHLAETDWTSGDLDQLAADVAEGFRSVANALDAIRKGDEP